MSYTIYPDYNWWIMSWNTRNVLDLQGQSSANNQPVIGYWAHYGPKQATNQKWITTLQSTTNGVDWYTLTNAMTKTILALPPGKTNVVCQTSAATDGSQYWSFVRAGDGPDSSNPHTPSFKIKNQLSGTFIDIQNDGPPETPVVSLSDAGGSTDHRWIMFPAVPGPVPTTTA